MMGIYEDGSETLDSIKGELFLRELKEFFY
jgi:hypothetical protein